MERLLDIQPDRNQTKISLIYIFATSTISLQTLFAVIPDRFPELIEHLATQYYNVGHMGTVVPEKLRGFGEKFRKIRAV